MQDANLCIKVITERIINVKMKEYLKQSLHSLEGDFLFKNIKCLFLFLMIFIKLSGKKKKKSAPNFN